MFRRVRNLPLQSCGRDRGGNLFFIRASTYGQWHAINSVIGIGIVIAMRNVPQVVNVRMEVPIPGNIIKRVVLHHEVHDVLNLDSQ